VSAADECATLYNSQPAVIIDAGLSSFDQSNAYHVYSLYGSNAWIGMTITDVYNLSTYQWADGTPYEWTKYDPTACVGSCSPWIDNGPDGNGRCVQITSNGWNTAPCNEVAYTLCNLPSELQTDLNEWLVVHGHFDFVNGTVHSMAVADHPAHADLEVVDNFAWIPDTQWFNGQNGDVRIEYRFSVAFGDEYNKYAGVVIMNALDMTSDCRSYHVGVLKHRPGVFELGLYQHSDGSTNTLASTRLSTWDDRKFYVLLIQMSKGNKFIITLDDNSLVYGDSLNTNVLMDTSGYIGLFSSAGIDVESSWLYISGTPLLIPNVTHSECMLNVSSPVSNIDITSSAPTNEPTLQPNVSPSTPIIVAITAKSSTPSPNTSEPETLTTAEVIADEIPAGDDDAFSLWNLDLMQIIVLTMAIWIIVLTVLVCGLMAKNRRLQNRKHSILQTAIQDNIAKEKQNDHQWVLGAVGGEADGEVNEEDSVNQGDDDIDDEEEDHVGVHIRITPMTLQPHSRARALPSMETTKTLHKASDTSFDEIYDKVNVRSCPVPVPDGLHAVGGGGLFDMHSEGAVTSLSNHTAATYLQDANYGVMHFLRSRKGTGNSTKNTSKPPKSSITESVDAMFEDPAHFAENVTLSP